MFFQFNLEADSEARERHSRLFPLFLSQWPWFLSDLFCKLYNVFCLEILIDLSRPLSRGGGIARARRDRRDNFSGLIF